MSGLKLPIHDDEEYLVSGSITAVAMLMRDLLSGSPSRGAKHR